MLRQKLHQELFRSVKEKQEREQDAYLPPGLINHGNTCFMNSVLQGLVASEELYDLVHFDSNCQPFQTETSGPILAKRSPQLTNDHGLGGSADHQPINSMPLGDAFVRFLLRAWLIQDDRRREIITPKEVLAMLGRKYDQYLDFRQQDAHEFLRLLLDAMRMEELDVREHTLPPDPLSFLYDYQVIKKVQPPLKPKRKSRPPQPHATPDTPGIPPEEKLQSFIDMLFGGKLTSFLVCETCKHISHTYEDFNDLSLSIKPEDFAKERKRNKFKSFAKKFAVRSDNDPPPMSRASSVPPDPVRKNPPENIPEVTDPRVRSQEDLHELVDSDADLSLNPNSLSSPAVLVPNGPHIEFVEPDKDKKPDPDRWVKLKRFSRGVQGKKNERSRSRGRSSRLVDEYLKPVLIPSDTSGQHATDYTLPSTREATPNPSEKSSRAVSPHHPKSIKPLISDIVHSYGNGKSHKDKLTAAKSAYLRHILADVTPANPFSALLSGVSNVGAPAQNGYTLWNKLSQIPSVEESLRMFTSVEMLEGENMVGCRNCWKIANRPEENQGDSSDTSESDKDVRELSPGSPGSASSSLSPLPPSVARSVTSESVLDSSQPPPRSISASAISLVHNHSSLALENKGPSTISLPATVELAGLPPKPPPLRLDRPIPGDDKSPDLSPDVSHPATYAGFTIPVISTTGPETPMTSSTTSPTLPPTSIYNLASASLNPPRLLRRRTPRRQPVDSDSSDDSFDDTDASLSDASSPRSAPVSPFASQEELHKNPSIDAVLSSPKPIPHSPELEKPKVPRSKQVVMRRFYKRYLIADPPLILVVHLKRFQQTSRIPFMSFSAGFKKLDEYVTFPEYLDITPFLAPNKGDFGLPIRKLRQSNRAKGKCMYRLYAVVVHIGNILGGHYIAYTALPHRAKHLKDSQGTESVGFTPTTSDTSLRSDKSDKVENHDKSDKREKGHEKNEPRQWAYISDTVVRLTTLDEVLKSRAYMCLYERIS
ncbi:cysteine proteinase [Thelephora terrestris]|uniref:Ubiquitin carboxyl-terminal hydrolase n=1 Tax=Thelephora terrestris TaxID=56493 RepID=A0A9P6L9L1_9AGAM|nr:cysteine proteinase [Thelephora terrestris]